MIYTIILLVIADFFLLLAWVPNVFPHYTIYWLMLNFDTLRLQLACAILPISTVVMFILIFIPRADPAIHLLIALIMLAANVIACCARVPGFNFRTDQQDSMAFSPYIYHVVSFSQLSMNDHIYISLYECDQFDFLCRMVFDQDSSSSKTELQSDASSHTVILQIDSKTVYVHQVK